VRARACGRRLPASRPGATPERVGEMRTGPTRPSRRQSLPALDDGLQRRSERRRQQQRREAPEGVWAGGGARDWVCPR
jgi:hypothetical protein